MKKFPIAGLFCLLLLTGALHAAERNIVVFITDDQSPTLGCYGDPVAVTPHADRLAADGTRFTHAYATTASCSASRSVVLSGLHNHLNGQYGHTHHFHKFSSYHHVAALALPRVLTLAGYRTARVGKYHVAPAEVYKFDQTLKASPRHPERLANACEAFIDEDPSRPFFIYIGTVDPHRGPQDDASVPGPHKPNLFWNLPDRKHHPGVTEVFFDPQSVPVPPFLPDTPECRFELAHYYQSCARIDQSVGAMIELLKKKGLYDKTLFLFTSDHGMAFPGGKTTVYEGGLHVPFIVRDPYQSVRGVVNTALISHADITPSLLDFAGALDHENNRPKPFVDGKEIWKDAQYLAEENTSGGFSFNRYHGRSWMPILSTPNPPGWDEIFASHTFHEIQMYYPMRVVRDRSFKLIWNIAHGLDYPFASDLWAASTWQAQYKQGKDTPYGQKTVGTYIHRPAFELYAIDSDPHESTNLADNPKFADTLNAYKKKLKEFQKVTQDPWILKWKYE